MKKLKIPILLLILIPICFSFTGATEYQGDAKISYILLEEKGNSAFFQERYNLNKGIVLSKLNFEALFNFNRSFHFNLSNLNADTRNIFMDLKIPKTFSFEAKHIRSRYIFDDLGDINSFRTNTSTALSFTPFEFLKLKGSYTHQKKTGERLSYPRNVHSFLGTKYDQTLQAGEIGAQLKWENKFLDISQGLREFKSELNDSLNRRTYITKVSLNSPLGEKAYFSGQYFLNQAKVKESGKKLTSNFLGLAFSKKPNDKLLVFLKGSYWATKDEITSKKTDVLKGSLNLNYLLKNSTELQGGVELERRDEKNEDAFIVSFLLGALVKPSDKLTLKAKYQGSFSDYSNGVKVIYSDPGYYQGLLGEYNINKILFEAKYKPKEQLSFLVKYLDHSRENTDINTKAQSRTALVGAVLSCTKMKADLEGEYSFSDSRYDNYLGSFHTNNHSITSKLSCSPLDKLNLFAGYNFLSLKKDLDIEKHNFFAGGSYEFYKQFSLEGSYHRFQYDDMKIIANYYEANVVKISLGKKF